MKFSLNPKMLENLTILASIFSTLGSALEIPRLQIYSETSAALINLITKNSYCENNQTDIENSLTILINSLTSVLGVAYELTSDEKKQDLILLYMNNKSILDLIINIAKKTSSYVPHIIKDLKTLQSNSSEINQIDSKWSEIPLKITKDELIGLRKLYKSQNLSKWATSFFVETSGKTTLSFFQKALDTENDNKRAEILCSYLNDSNNKNLGFYKFLTNYYNKNEIDSINDEKIEDELEYIMPISSNS